VKLGLGLSLAVSLAALLASCMGDEIEPATFRPGDPVGSPNPRDGQIVLVVLDSSGAPVLNASVEFELQSPPFTSDQMARLTGADGTFRETLDPGHYSVRVVGPDGSEAEDEFEIEAGEKVDLEFNLQSP
jgi:hypothetical protein